MINSILNFLRVIQLGVSPTAMYQRHYIEAYDNAIKINAILSSYLAELQEIDYEALDDNDPDYGRTYINKTIEVLEKVLQNNE